MHQYHENLSPEVNAAISENELQGGVFMKDLAVGSSLLVATRNTKYVIEKREDGTYIKGNAKYCPEFTKCSIAGSTWGGSMLKMDFIGRDMLLEFHLLEGAWHDHNPTNRIVTSTIQEIIEL